MVGATPPFLMVILMDKKKLAYDLFIESVLKPDPELRKQATEQDCLEELLAIRESVLKYLYSDIQF